MSPLMTDDLDPLQDFPEGGGPNLVATLAKNVVLARGARKWTQEELARRSDISRATIAQIESGDSDPHLKTLVQLAGALEVSPLLLLIGRQEIRAIAALVRDSGEVDKVTAELPASEVQRMEELADSGMQRSQKKAAAMGSSVALTAGLAAGGAAVGAAIGTILMPGIGTAVGAALGSLLHRKVRSR
jgi:transcriptional regulator with XRE-family HTH domain